MAGPVGESESALALAEAQAAGVLPLTSVCNVSCVFCSNRSNPPGVRVFTVPPRSPAELRAAIQAMAHLDEIVIGESASRISEGEPLTHPLFDQVVRLVRELAPNARLRLTTNGVLLDHRRARLLAGLGRTRVTLSLNTASREAFRLLTGCDHDPRTSVRALAEAGVEFSASVVAFPALTGAADIVETVRLLDEHGCRDCRVFVPAFTSRTRPGTARLFPSRAEVAELVAEARAAVTMPVTMEPPEVNDLRAVVAGVKKTSPARRAGIRAGDEIKAVDGRPPRSRVDAFRACAAALGRRGRCRLTVASPGDPGEREAIVARAPEDESPDRGSGLVMDRDFDPADGELIFGLASRLGARRVVVLTSRLAVRAMTLGLPGALVLAVPSVTFGGSIACAGLLTVPDFARVLRLARSSVDETAAGEDAAGFALKPGDALFLPPAAFDSRGLDLLGRSPAELGPLLPRGVRLVVPGVAVF